MIKLKLLLVDDHMILLDGIKALLKGSAMFDIVGEAMHGADALAMIKNVQPDIVVTDIQMPGMSGIELTTIIKQEYPNIKVLALSMSGTEDDIVSMVEAGISGYILKNTGKQELTDALVKIAEGGMYFSEAVTMGLTNAMRHRKSKSDTEIAIHITPREKEIIKLIVKEYRNQQIAESLFISEQTVETHRKNIFRKTNSKSIVGLIKYAIEHNLD